MKQENATFKVTDNASEAIARKVDLTQWEELTEEERAHLTEYDMPDLETFKKGAANQKEWRDAGKSEPCYTCKAIAKKLNVPV